MTDCNNLQHETATPANPAPELEINFVDPERFQFGQWCGHTQRLNGEGDISASYSADRIGMSEPVRQPFRWKGALWVNTGGWHRDHKQRIEAYRLVPVSLFKGETQSYAQTVVNGEAARRSAMGFYHGMKVEHGGKVFVLCGKPEVFAPSNAEQFSLF